MVGAGFLTKRQRSLPYTTAVGIRAVDFVLRT
jgi:hypothetical protein